MTALTLTTLSMLSLPASAERAVPDALVEVGVVEQLSMPVDTNLQFTDHNGQTVTLGDYLDDGKPVLLTLNYYSCETLCSIHLNGLVAGLKDTDWTAGNEFRIVTVSIDPSEGPELARAKRQTYLDALGQPDADWSFLVGDQANISALAETVGFGYRYDEKSEQWAHPAVLTFLSPDAVVARYLYGITYPGRDLEFALIEASAGRVGSPVEKLILSCFQYDHVSGEYTPQAMGVMRLGGIATLMGLGALGAVMYRREKRRRARSPKA